MTSSSSSSFSPSDSAAHAVADVLGWIDQKQDVIVDYLRELIRTPSETGQEGEIQMVIADRLRQLGLRVDVWEPDWDRLRRHPGYVAVERGYERRPNVVGTLPGKGGGRSLLFNGHTDVIPPGSPQGWQHGPWSGDVAEGRIYGRGSSDMKAGLVAMTMAVEALIGTGQRLRGDLILEYTVDEELSGNGTLDCVQHGYRADAGICCETSSMRVQPASIGRIWFEIRVNGRPAGIQRHWEGVSAIDKGYLLTGAVSDFEQSRISRVTHPLYPDIRSAIPCMVGAFQSGSYHSAFPDSCTLKGSLATLPGEDSVAVKDEFVTFIQERAQHDAWLKEHPPEVEFSGYFAEASEISSESLIVQTLCSSFRSVVGAEPLITGREGAADTRHLNKYGQTPTVIFGPGLTEQMHASNEWVGIDDLIMATKVLASTALSWCG